MDREYLTVSRHAGIAFKAEIGIM